MPNRKSPVNGAELPRGRPFEAGVEAQQAGRRGGKKSGEARKLKRTLREQLELLLAEEREDGRGNKKTVQAGITASLVKAALEGNTKAYEIIRDTIGQKPAETVNLNTPDNDVMEQIRKRMAQYEP